MYTDELNFDLTPVEIPVTIGGKAYVLREATEAAACTWKNTAISKARVRDGKVESLGNLADQQPLLVSLCLFEQGEAEGSKEKAVSLQTVKSWPSRVVSALFEKAKDISKLGEDEAPETVGSLDEKINTLMEKREKLMGEQGGDTYAKNSQDGTTGGCD